MQNERSVQAGKFLYAGAALAIGCIHFVTRGFPSGLLPVVGHTAGAITCGAALVAVSLGILFTSNAKAGLAAALVWLVLFGCIHLPRLLPHLRDGGEWTASLEVLALCSGGLLCAGGHWRRTGMVLLALTLLGFGILHFIYLDYIVFLIPAWIPGKIVFAWLVMLAFFAAAGSLLLRRHIRWCALLLAVMFGSWVLLLHLPRVAAHAGMEPEWTSLCVALAMTGIAGMLYRPEIPVK